MVRNQEITPSAVQPLAVSIIFGLSVSLLVTLFLIPVVYQWLHSEATRIAVSSFR